MKNIDNSEIAVNLINQSVFFKEFVFSDNTLKSEDKNEFELADSIVWLDDILLLFQIKTRDLKSVIDSNSEEKWFKKKVISKAKCQIKDTIGFFYKYKNLSIKNNRGFVLDLKSAPVNNAKKIIIYTPSKSLSEKYRLMKFYNSSEVGLIHLFNLEDYENICKYLVTPAEINDYLRFRELEFHYFKNNIDTIPEQLIFGHFLSGDPIEDLDYYHLEYLQKFTQILGDFDLSQFLMNFYEKQVNSKLESIDYYHIVKEIAKLNRLELKLFKERLVISLEKSKENYYVTPYRMMVPRTGCGFVFIPLTQEEGKNWNIILQNLTLAHKYDQKIDKCIGVVVFKDTTDSEWVEIYWCYIDFKWQFEKEWEEKLNTSFPFRQVKVQELGNPYTFTKNTSNTNE